MIKWEYKTINFMPNEFKLSSKFYEKEISNIEEKLIKLGEEGWELVSNTSYDAGTKFILIFKRPKETI